MLLSEPKATTPPMANKMKTESTANNAPLRLMCIFDLNISQNVYGFIIAEYWGFGGVGSGLF
jgi:hypothetical protein